MVGILIYIILIMVYIVLPIPLQVIFFLTNIMVPDPIPVLDELVMMISLFRKMSRVGRFLDFVDKHPILFKLLVLIVISGIVYLIIL